MGIIAGGWQTCARVRLGPRRDTEDAVAAPRPDQPPPVGPSASSGVFVAWSSQSSTWHPTDWPAIRRRIRARDRSCRWPDEAGRPCGSTDRLQVDRRVPYAEGGTADDANLWLLCHGHHARKTRDESRRSYARRRARPEPVHPARARRG